MAAIVSYQSLANTYPFSFLIISGNILQATDSAEVDNEKKNMVNIYIYIFFFFAWELHIVFYKYLILKPSYSNSASYFYKATLSAGWGVSLP